MGVLPILLALLSWGCTYPSSKPQPQDIHVPALKIPVALQATMDVVDSDEWAHPLLGGQSLGQYVRGRVSEIRLATDEELGQAIARYERSSKTVFYNIEYLPGLGKADVIDAAGTILHEAAHYNRDHSCSHWLVASRDQYWDTSGPYAIHTEYLKYKGKMEAYAYWRWAGFGCGSLPEDEPYD